MRLTRSAAVVVLLALGASACSAGNGGSSRPSTATLVAATSPDTALRTISAHALGKATATPDLLTITIGVQTQGPRASAVLADNNSRAAAVIAKLRSGGVADKDVQTAQLSINPTYAGGPTPVITGYQVSDLVTAKLRKLDSAGALIDAAAAAAGDAARIEGLSFSIADDSALLAAARADAVRQAVARIKTMADAAGVSLGHIRSITDQSVTQPQVFNQAGGFAAAPSADRAAVPIQAGSQDLTVDVAVVYDIAS